MSAVLGAYEDPVPRVLLDIQRQKPTAFSRAEKLYHASKDPMIQARLATLLAFAPKNKISEAPAIYALFAFDHDQSLPKDFKVKLAKLAGEAFFVQGGFNRAKTIYAKALEMNPDETDSEYFNYQIAWCDLNDRRPDLAFERLRTWILNCKQCQLRREILKDLGRAYAEIADPAKPPPSTFDFLKFKTDSADFMEGFASTLRRKPASALEAATRIFLTSPLLAEWLHLVFETSTFDNHSACEILVPASLAPVEAWPLARVRSTIHDCAQSNSEKNPKTMQRLANLSERLPQKTGTDLLIYSDILERSQKTTEACVTRLQAAADIQLPWDVYLPTLFAVCKNIQGERLVDPLVHLLDLPRILQRYAVTKNKDAALIFYLQSIAQNNEWRRAFESLPPTWIPRYRPGSSTFAAVLQSSVWDVTYRLKVWQAAPDAAAMDPTNLQTLARDLFSAGRPEPYQSLMRQAQARARPLTFSIVLLEARGLTRFVPSLVTDWQDLYQKSLSAVGWAGLSDAEQQELFRAWLAHLPLQSIFEHWAFWSPVMTNNTSLYNDLLQNVLQGKDVNIQSLIATNDGLAQVIVAAVQVQQDPELPLDFSKLKNARPAWIDDLRRLGASARDAHSLRDLVFSNQDDSQMAQTVDKGLALASRAVQTTQKSKFTLPALEDRRQQMLKEAIHTFGENLKGKTEYRKIARLLQQWEKKL
jgi:tetratricopeptide (TPR) repeat protein